MSVKGPLSVDDRHEAGGADVDAWLPSGTGEPFGEWELPGMGDAAPTCGEWAPNGFCHDEGHVNYGVHLCGRRECPDCWSSQWAGPRTASVVARLAAARYAVPEGVQRRAVHTVASPPAGTVETIEGYYQARRRASEIARDHGVRGGVVVAHGYRVLEETKEEFQGCGSDLSLWRWIRENERGWKDQVEWSPHFHIVGLARDVKPSSPDSDDGWIFKNIRSLGSFEGIRDRDAYVEMVKAVRYLLSHATFPAEEDRHAVTWYGDLHPTNFQPTEELSDGAWARIVRAAEEVVGAGVEEEEESGAGECDVDDCEGRVASIWRARDYLQRYPDAWDLETRQRVVAAYEWVTGRTVPPPGLKHPQSEGEAEEVLAQLVSGVGEPQ